MFDIGWDELLLIALVALVVIGPKDLPAVLRTLGAWMARARNLAGEFRSHVDEMMREANVDEMKREFTAMAATPEMKEIEDQLMTGNLPASPEAKKPETLSEAAPQKIEPATDTVRDDAAE
jgi:sec-independent protein translocase protein TatB